MAHFFKQLWLSLQIYQEKVVRSRLETKLASCGYAQIPKLSRDAPLRIEARSLRAAIELADNRLLELEHRQRMLKTTT